MARAKRKKKATRRSKAETKPEKVEPRKPASSPPAVFGFLTAKQRRFVVEYSKDENATQAAIRAGYSEGGAAQTGHHLLRNPKIQEALREGVMAGLDASELDIEDIMRVVAAVITFDPATILDDNGETLPISQWPEQARMACAGFEIKELFDWEDKKRIRVGQTVKPKWYDRLEGIDKLARLLGAYAPEKKTVTLTDGDVSEKTNEELEAIIEADQPAAATEH